MSQADVERFVADLKNDEALRTGLGEHSTGIASVVEWANQKGYDISAEEASAYIHGQAGRELSDNELDAVAGGKGGPTDVTNTHVETQVVVLVIVVAT